VDPADLASPPAVAPGSLDGVQLMLMAVPQGEILPAGGASVGVLMTPIRRRDGPANRVRRPDHDDSPSRRSAGRAQIAIDGDAFAARGVPLDELLPYVDAIVRGPEGSRRAG